MNRTLAQKILLVSAGLHRRGGGVGVVGRLTGRALVEMCAREGRGFQALDLGPPEDSGIPEVTSFLGDHRRLAQRTAWLQIQQKIGVVCFDHVGPARVQTWLPRGLRAPYAVWMHGIEVWRPLQGDRRRALEGAGLLIANSSFTWERAAKENPWIAALPHCVVHLAVEDRLPVGGKGSPQGPYFLMVGRLSSTERYKGHLETIEAFSRIAADHPEARLLIAGDGDDRARLEARASESAPEGSIKLLGWVGDDELESLLAGCRALVLPSQGEGFGLVYIEALKHGRPFVACSGTVAAEVAGNSEAAVLVPYGDVDALAEALRALLADPEACDRRGAAGLQAAGSRFTESVFRQRFEAAFQRLLRSPSGKSAPATLAEAGR